MELYQRGEPVYLLTLWIQGGLLAKYLVYVATFSDSISFDMQRDHVMKKLKFYLLKPSPRVVRRGGGGGG